MRKLNKQEIDFLVSRSDSDLQSILSTFPASEQEVILAQLMSDSPVELKDERTQQRELMARKRAAARDLELLVPASVGRRRDCLADPFLFLQTYFGSTFFQGFTEDRRAMLEGIIAAAKYGGDSAIAGPRGEGKTRLAMYGALYLMISGLSPFPFVIGKSGTKSINELKTIRERLQSSELFIADFPEIGLPFAAVGPWSSRARMQTVGGLYTGIEMGSEHIIFPTITEDMLPDGWPEGEPSLAKGQMMASMGIDGPIRGTNYRDVRPTLAILDDIEDKEAASSDTIIKRNKELIDEDIGGLGGNVRRVSRIMLCTIQNRKCIAYQYTDPEQFPSWRGRRYRKCKVKPIREDLWQQYIELRESRTDDDPDARAAYRFYRDNQTEMDAGAVMSNPEGFDRHLHSDGEPMELTALQAYYNRVADLGAKAVSTEEDNDPPETVGPQGMGLSPAIVMDRLNGLSRRQVPASAASLTAGIDLGKYRCHWVVCAWFKGAGGCVIDYGVQEVVGQGTHRDRAEDMAASEPQIYNALLDLRSQFLQADYVDASGAKRALDCILVDSGTYSNAAYEFCRQVGSPFHPSKGIGNYRERKTSDEKTMAGDHMHAGRLDKQGLWLFELDTDYWKNWVHERFLTPTFDEQNMLRQGALSLYDLPGRQKHLSYAHHICAEELVTEFKEGKGSKTYWHVVSDNNHWLDATYNAAAAARYTGVKLLSNVEAPQNVPRVMEPGESKRRKSPSRRVRHGVNFRTRPGGWIRGMRHGKG